MRNAKFLVIGISAFLYASGETTASAVEVRIKNNAKNTVSVVAHIYWSDGVSTSYQSEVTLSGFYSIAPGESKTIYKRSGGVVGVWLRLHSARNGEWNPGDRDSVVLTSKYVRLFDGKYKIDTRIGSAFYKLRQNDRGARHFRAGGTIVTKHVVQSLYSGQKLRMVRTNLREDASERRFTGIVTIPVKH